MRDLKKNQQNMWYALFDKTVPRIDANGDEAGDEKNVYKKPVRFRANLSPGQGKAYRALFGTDVDFERTISTTNMFLPITENSLIWEKTEPIFLDDGMVDENSADYEVAAKPLKALNVLVIAIKSRSKNGEV